MTFRCATCNEEHEGLPDLGSDAPDVYGRMTPEERTERATLTADTCVVRSGDQVDYFVRGVLEIPVLGQSERFGFGVWVSQSEANFERYVRGSLTDPTFGWLSTELAHVPASTLNLKTRLHPRSASLRTPLRRAQTPSVPVREAGLRPTIELEPTDHPLAVAQRTGITLERAWAIVHRYGAS